MALKDKIRVRRDTTANFTSTNPVLALGEISFDTTTKQFKVGDGSTAWVSLSYSDISATNLTTGTLPDARLSATVARRDQDNTLAGALAVNGTLTVGDGIGNETFVLGNSSDGFFVQVNSVNKNVVMRQMTATAAFELTYGSILSVNRRSDAVSTLTLDSATHAATFAGRITAPSIQLEAGGPILRKFVVGTTFETLGDGGLRVQNTAGTAGAGITCSSLNASRIQTSTGAVRMTIVDNGSTWLYGGGVIPFQVSNLTGTGLFAIADIGGVVTCVASGILSTTGAFQLASRTKLTLPSAASSNGDRYRLTDSDVVANRMVFCNGTAWFYEGTAVAV